MARKAKPATAAYLERVALWYLERWPGSVARVRRVLDRRVRRSVSELGTDPAEGAAAVETVIAKLQRIGLLDDARFAAARVESLRRRGVSRRAIVAKLRSQGIATHLVDEALAAAEDDVAAARTFARKRRIGPHRPGPERSAHRERDLARLGRAGFPFDVARRVIDEDPER